MTRNDVVEIVIHGRGGQGSVTAANLDGCTSGKDWRQGRAEPCPAGS